MRIVQYASGGATGCGVEVDGAVFATGYADTLALIRDGERGLERAAAAADGADPVAVDRSSRRSPTRARSSAPASTTASHGDEEPGYVFPDEVVWDFIKLASAIIGPGDDIVIPPADDVIVRRAGGAAQFAEYGFAVDYEVEFGVVLGARAKNVRREDALDHVFGYTVFNDVGSRSVQFHNGQRDLGKNFDTFCPMGPCIVTKDELPDWEAIRIQSHVNGELRQDALVGEQTRAAPGRDRVAQLDHHARAGRLPDDGHARRLRHVHGSRRRSSQPGDVVTVSASGIGELTNPVVQGTARTR